MTGRARTSVFVGTSGWFYDWNPDGLEWYVSSSGLNAVELNASFYRFPRPSTVRRWAGVGEGIRWAVKVHRGITHTRRLSRSALGLWERFEDLFSPLDGLIDFYLFQMPPSFSRTPESERRVGEFAAESGLRERMAVEFRHPSWFSEGVEEWARDLGITLVSVDAPELPRTVFNTSQRVYLRMHGRTWWYAHRYTLEELTEVARSLLALDAEAVYVFFNNDHDMLDNGRTMLALLGGEVRGQRTLDLD